jgi:hypothetical protein
MKKIVLRWKAGKVFKNGKCKEIETYTESIRDIMAMNLEPLHD